MISLAYRGSVKDLWGPARVGATPAVVFEYTDSFSVFDWGRMPDLLPKKGVALAVMAAEIFERLEKPESWKEFSRSSEALLLRKGNRFGSVFNELGEELQAHGLRTHYLGALSSSPSNEAIQPQTTAQLKDPFRHLVVKGVTVVKPKQVTVLGRSLPDYTATRNSQPPRLAPLEVVFRMACPPGSSLLERVAKDPGYIASLGFPELKVNPGTLWDFPLLELFTKLENTDRLVSLSEALAISGIPANTLQEILLKTAWVSGILRYWFARSGMQLADGKLEWGVDEKGGCFLVDAVGPDELRILKDGVQLSKEFLRAFYRGTRWYELLEKAKLQAKNQGSVEWKKAMQEPPPVLPPAYRDLAVQVYLCLANELCEKKWFPEAWGLAKVVEELKKVSSL